MPSEKEVIVKLEIANNLVGAGPNQTILNAAGLESAFMDTITQKRISHDDAIERIKQTHAVPSVSTLIEELDLMKNIAHNIEDPRKQKRVIEQIQKQQETICSEFTSLAKKSLLSKKTPFDIKIQYLKELIALKDFNKANAKLLFAVNEGTSELGYRIPVIQSSFHTTEKPQSLGFLDELSNALNLKNENAKRSSELTALLAKDKAVALNDEQVDKLLERLTQYNKGKKINHVHASTPSDYLYKAFTLLKALHKNTDDLMQAIQNNKLTTVNELLQRRATLLIDYQVLVKASGVMDNIEMRVSLRKQDIGSHDPLESRTLLEAALNLQTIESSFESLHKVAPQTKEHLYAEMARLTLKTHEIESSKPGILKRAFEFFFGTPTKPFSDLIRIDQEEKKFQNKKVKTTPLDPEEDFLYKGDLLHKKMKKREETQKPETTNEPEPRFRHFKKQ